jgi:hypothetical protein
MIKRWQLDIDFVEQGDIYFFYKPKKGIDKPESIDDVSRFYFVLDPYGKIPPRYIVMGNKKMPEVTDGGQKTTWGFVQIVGGRGFEAYKKAAGPAKGASRPAGEGIYSIITHRDHSHLLYSLELPEKLGEVQDAFAIKKEANYIFLERPVEVAPSGPEMPFSNFSPVVNSNNLNLRGTEVLLVGVGADIGRLGLRVEKDKETLNSADIFSRLKVDTNRHPTASLISGEWE